MKNGKISNFCQVGGVKQYVMENGAAQGLRVIECDNGKLRFLLNVSKALDIMQVFYEGKNISFVSKNGFMARELPFGKRFEGGMLYTCGLDGIGAVDGVELHGNLHCTPATVTRAECTDEGIVIESYTTHTALFGNVLTLKRKIFSRFNSDKIELEDTLFNEGTKTAPYCLLYHVNLGYPLLDDGGRVEVNAENVSARSDWAIQNLSDWSQISAPVDNAEEMCYFIDNKDGKATYVNEKQGKRFVLEYSKETLPNFVLWKSMVSGDYALGLEPCTSLLDDGFSYREIGVGERKTFRLSLSLETF